jgi:hypothetical protein
MTEPKEPKAPPAPVPVDEVSPDVRHYRYDSDDVIPLKNVPEPPPPPPPAKKK